jgi:hypothetical protein
MLYGVKGRGKAAKGNGFLGRDSGFDSDMTGIMVLVNIGSGDRGLGEIG